MKLLAFGTQTEPNHRDHVVPIRAPSLFIGLCSSDALAIRTAVVRGTVVAPASLVGRSSPCEYTRSRLRLRQLLASEASQPPLRSSLARRSVLALWSSRCGRRAGRCVRAVASSFTQGALL